MVLPCLCAIACVSEAVTVPLHGLRCRLPAGSLGKKPKVQTSNFKLDYKEILASALRKLKNKCIGYVQLHTHQPHEQSRGISLSARPGARTNSCLAHAIAWSPDGS